jgi:hypothetical protein
MWGEGINQLSVNIKRNKGKKKRGEGEEWMDTDVCAQKDDEEKRKRGMKGKKGEKRDVVKENIKRW